MNAHELTKEAQRIGITPAQITNAMGLLGDAKGMKAIEEAIRQHKGKRSANKQLRTEHEAHEVLVRYNAEKSGMSRSQIATIMKDFGADLGPAVLLGGVQLRKEMQVKQAGKAAVGYKDNRTPSKPASVTKPTAAKAMMVPVDVEQLEAMRHAAKIPDPIWDLMTRRLSESDVWEWVQAALPGGYRGKSLDKFWRTWK